MNDIQILKEIAFYSKLINQQKKKLKYNTEQKFVGYNTFNKFKYVKKDSAVILPQKINKVLINPNFKKIVHVNPLFNIQTRVIHVNPKVLNNPLSSNVANQTQMFMKPEMAEKHTEVERTVRKRRLSVHTKYKIVKSHQNTSKLMESNKTIIKDRYKIDRRGKGVMKKKIFQGLSDMLRHNVFKNKIWRKSGLINQFKLNNTGITNISGVLYTKTQTKLEKISQKRKLVKINKSLRRSSLKLVKTRRLKQNKMRKNNQPCPVYRRYGKCRRKEAGRCNFVHNSNQIFLCKKFLQGACIDKNCLLSHKISKEKMPTCKYFLEGCCVRNDCPYLHVKINAKAGICRKFLEGYCEKGLECDLRHQFLCPNFEKYGKCPSRKCLYPHKDKTEKTTMRITMAEHELKPVPVEPLIAECAWTARYYTDVECCAEDTDEQVKMNIKKPKLGTLPSFIPF